MDYGKYPLYEELNQRYGIKNVVIIIFNITEESLIKNPKEILKAKNSL